ncbi:MAG: hypothetical protein HIU91_11890, partial [Acidobacteria bacterium]|nr:hypothetical protein [Acidobacteriota bacterium]
MRALALLAAFTLTAPLTAPAQWQLQQAPTTADLRGIQAFDATTAIAMSSGPGDLSRLYKTT